MNSSISGDITIPSTLGGYPVTSIDQYAFFSCESLETVYYSGSEEQRGQIVIGVNNEILGNATWLYNYTPEVLTGDLNGDGEVTGNDAIYLLYHTFVPDTYSLN